MRHYPAECNILLSEVKDFGPATLNDLMIQHFKRDNMSVDIIEVSPTTWQWMRVNKEYTSLLDLAVTQSNRIRGVDSYLLGIEICQNSALSCIDPSYGCMKMINNTYKRTLTMQAWLR